MSAEDEQTTEFVWEHGPHANAWNGCDVRCREVPRDDAQRTTEYVALSEAERSALWAGIQRARYEDAPISLARESNRTHVLWAITPAVERIIADRLAAAVARAEAAEARVTAARDRLDLIAKVPEMYRLLIMDTAEDQERHKRVTDAAFLALAEMRRALADVPTSAPTGEA